MTHKQWEYRVEDCAAPDDLDALGAEGWELIGSVAIILPDPEDESVETPRPTLVFERERA